MARPRGSKNKKRAKNTIEKAKDAFDSTGPPGPSETVKLLDVIPVPKEPEKDNSGLEDRPYFSVDEAAQFLGVDERCARLWFEHGHLTGTNDVGFIRVSRASMLRVKHGPLIVGPMG